ncbi:pilus assembly protein N-terminal domain-containing protein [Notoacmeibacter sp. MSK16QG-6]|uniref:pilus assembly protein N-terminal domain-containing protein n=1 Tax=Notoacmeibacter sp. MSK16QG-6 TaxID=2957982 RepID=UPI0020A15EBD|nr:pilus assembly protein N-terminal domain-containing protein [Notoacmeibacter sp. MSK16QG-6]MCP1198771.1 pilus assembly protein N-terminal domain-containing protein [Notoacmeibacter sp. MSK16QG-6]
MRLALLTTLSISGALATGIVAAQAAEGISIDKGNARIVKLVEPAETVIVGEPTVADVTVKDSRTLVLTGRTYGSTNLVVFNAAGEPIVDQPVIVSRQGKGSVRLYRRDDVEMMTCLPVCEKDTIGGTDGENDG